jgi:hypothetical protein
LPEGGSINYNAILQLDMFCKKEGKWTEAPYIWLFFFPRDHPEWLNKCRIDTQATVTLYKKPQNSLEEPQPEKPSNNAQGPPTMWKEDSPMTEINSPGEPQGICPTLKPNCVTLGLHI